MAKVEVEQDDLNALSYAIGDIADKLSDHLSVIRPLLDDHQFGPVFDTVEKLRGLSTAVLKPTG